MTYTSHGPFGNRLELSGSKVGIYWLLALAVIVVLELNALGMMPWKTEANKGLNLMYDGTKEPLPMVPNFAFAAIGLWFYFLILTEIFFRS